MNGFGRLHQATLILAALLVALAVFNLERARSGLDITQFDAGTTPVTRYQLPGANGPLVVVAHGFAGSRQLMHSYSLDLAKAGYIVLAFDMEGHGRNPVPMSGDVTSVDGTTALLVAETQRVLAAGRALPETTEGVALLGHSMATDIIVRATDAETAAGRDVAAVVAISMFSEAMTASSPQRLLVISGQWESYLRGIALNALQQVQSDAKEGETVQSGTVFRRAVVAPHVEHVGVLFSSTATLEARHWLDRAFDRDSASTTYSRGPWIMALLFGIVVLFSGVAAKLPEHKHMQPVIGGRRFLAAILLPMIAVPLVATLLYVQFLPVLVADYLLIHLALFGVLQWFVLGAKRSHLQQLAPWAVFALVGWGIGVFGLALDRYAASFLPTNERLLIIAALCVGTIPYMLADSLVTAAGNASWWRRVAARIAFLVSLAAAALLDPERLTFLFIILPVLLLFFFVHGLMGRWVAKRCGPFPACIGLGLCLAWALGVSFPLFAGG